MTEIPWKVGKRYKALMAGRKEPCFGIVKQGARVYFESDDGAISAITHTTFLEEI